jgi:hypothetical protein
MSPGLIFLLETWGVAFGFFLFIFVPVDLIGMYRSRGKPSGGPKAKA